MHAIGRDGGGDAQEIDAHERVSINVRNRNISALTLELRRTAARRGGMLHASMQAEPRSGLGLNEMLAEKAALNH